MNRTDRLLAIILELQGKGHRRAQDLAATFETTRRTIYRDIQALSEAGVPIVAVPGQGYSLMEGYFLPPLRFTTDEATMLLLGSEFIAGHFDDHYRTAAQSATRKLEAVLPAALRADVRYLRDNIVFVSQNAPSPELAAVLAQVRRALLNRKTIRFKYHPRFGDEKNALSARTVNPYSIANIDTIWYLNGYDHARRALRHFRLDRVEAVELTLKTFARPQGYRVERTDGPHPITIRALFDPDRARWVRESNFYYITSIEDSPAGLLVTLHVRELREAVAWLLSWDSAVRILEPSALRELLRALAEKMVQNYSP